MCVVNITKTSQYDVYCGRASRFGEESKWHNPFKIGVDGTRSEVIIKYKEYLLGHPSLVLDLHELRGKILACFCAPRSCHCDVLAELANSPIEACIFCGGNGEKTVWSELYGDVIDEVCSVCDGRGWQYSNPILR